ncbi:MAG TPA: ATP-binding protein [Mariprofundaceae bacterium]|nr:ATP-binding protein [Mariprofundaceae bacterium]
MKRISLMRLLPLLMAAGMLSVAVTMWPVGGMNAGLLAWVNMLLLLVLSVMLIRYGIRLLRERSEPPPGSRLRAKLVIALVGMLLVPSMVIQIAASQMVERGMDVWFDVRVDTLLDRALNLAQGFYAREEGDIKRSMLDYLSDPAFLAAVEGRLDFRLANEHLNEVRVREGWDKLQLFDINERLIAVSQADQLSAFQETPLSENARLSMRLGRISTELVSGKDGEIAMGYAPLVGATAVEGLLRIEVKLPAGVIQDARSVEADYRSYRQLERNRQSIREMFSHVMLFVTLIVMLVTGLVALLFARRLTSPIGDLARALHRVTEGDLEVVIPESPQDELGSLVRSFNKMTDRLRQNVQAIENAQQEITDALASSRQRQYVLETLLANLQAGVLLVDADGRLRLLNQSARNILNLPEKWMPGIDFFSCCQGHLQVFGGFFDELRLQKDEHLQREFELSLPHGNDMRVLARGACLNASGASGSSGFSGYLLVIDDISELAEAQRSRAWAEVAQRLAHEIKNPLTPIKLAAERLQRRFRKQVDDTDVFDTCTQAIVGQVERLQRLIVDFSTLARMPQPKLRSIKAASLLQEMKDLFSTYPQVNVEVIDEGVECTCDPDQIRQILINLLDNAVAATDARQHVRAYITVAPDRIEWHVEDDGAGIDDEAVEHVFESYYSTKATGSGLGLAIARRIAEDHGGELTLVSAKAPTHFCLCLPMTSTGTEGE